MALALWPLACFDRILYQLAHAAWFRFDLLRFALDRLTYKRPGCVSVQLHSPNPPPSSSSSSSSLHCLLCLNRLSLPNAQATPGHSTHPRHSWYKQQKSRALIICRRSDPGRTRLRQVVHLDGLVRIPLETLLNLNLEALLHVFRTCRMEPGQADCGPIFERLLFTFLGRPIVPSHCILGSSRGSRPSYPMRCLQ